MAALAVLAACQKDDETRTSTARLTITASESSVSADGVNTVLIDVSGAAKAPILLTTTRGVFADNGARTTSIAATAGQVELRTCDAAADPQCAGLVSISGTDAGVASGVVSIQFIGAEICGNGRDDDQDTNADCRDPDCADAACQTAAGAAGTCSGGACTCTSTSSTETSCTDRRDDDCDGAVDCADADCAAASCTATGGGLGACQSGACVCTATQASETACGNSVDDDCDGAVDCDEAACEGMACAGGGTCRGGTCIPPGCAPTETAETSCGDSVDNDCDGTVDCADSTCAAQQCGETARYVCTSGACTDLASGFALELRPAATRVPADGTSRTKIVITLKQLDAPHVGSLQLETTAGTLSATTVQTDAAGQASVYLTAGDTVTQAVVTARLAGVPVSASTMVGFIGVGELSLKSVQYPVMGIRGSGFNEVSVIEVLVKDEDQTPFPEGFEVRFTHRPVGGSAISTPWQDVGTCTLANGCQAYRAVTNAGGVARVTLYSGTITGALALTATVRAGGPERTLLVSNRVTVVGARASAGSFSVVCDPQNVPALASTTCGASLMDESFTCVALLQDRFQNMLGAATQVLFMSEASRVGQVAVTPQYDPAVAPTQQAQLGSAVGLFGTLGGYLPADVPPVAGEFSFQHGADGCGIRTHNPRDGVVTVIATADGEEAFSDVNGSGAYDAGEPFVDLPEPYVDADDDGTRDPDEWFFDANGSGDWDGPNGTWDYDTKIWTQTIVVYSGFPLPAIDVDPDPAVEMLMGTRWHGPATTFPSACMPTKSAGPFSVLAGDEPTSATYAVYTSDQNFNRLASRATYSAATQAPATAEAFYSGLNPLPDSTGFFYAYWPCDVASGACATRCTTGRCEMRASIGSYSCGSGGPAAVQGGDKAESPIFADWTVTLSPVTVTATVSGASTEPPPPAP